LLCLVLTTSITNFLVWGGSEIILMVSGNSIIIQTEIYQLLIFQRNRGEQDESTASANSLGIDS